MKDRDLATPVPGSSPTCPIEGRWAIPPAGEPLTTTEILDRVADARVVLLGEDHDRAEDHRWQLQTIAALQGRHTDLVLAFEMLPRSSQPALDDWGAGKLGVDEFLERSRWFEVWGYAPELYLPIFQLGRMNRLPMIGLNVDHALIRKVSAQGWAAIPADQRAGLSTPAPASSEYRAMLAEVFEEHDSPEESDDQDALENFIDAQLVWDRAFAEGIRDALLVHPEAVVVAIIGRGHLEHGFGVEHQLADLGVRHQTTLLPWDVEQEDCDDLSPGLADAVFGLRRTEVTVRAPILGVFLEAGEGGVRVRAVAAGSVAERAGIEENDLLVEAAGREVTEVGQVKAAVARQPRGTVLPLTVERAGRRLSLEARFPTDE